MDKKFIVDGREVEWYYLKPQDIVSLIKNENTSAEDREYLQNRLVEVVENNLCPKAGETNDEVFARFFGNFVNGKLGDKNRVAKKMCMEHRYLQNEMFHVCLAYIKKLAENCEQGWYDPRNKYAAETSKKIIDYFKEINYPY